MPGLLSLTMRMLTLMDGMAQWYDFIFIIATGASLIVLQD
jgi:hypothetical protein